MTLKDKKEESNGIVSTVLTESLIHDLRQIINSLRFFPDIQIVAPLVRKLFWILSLQLEN